ncbi:hypothetical protein [Marinobacter arenosus]|uniref:hypothetical protein n=1 Tax=Marinobacter arenosus TaxID=2856822 RepID=UPI001C4CD8F9|nr:hypothetical protein [Marinobacter arenosus]MBW0147861.1 hypothetical protein [Marinobacter arenosus]
MELEKKRELLFPEGLINWSGAKRGGIRQPFQEGSGRPVKEQFTTPLVEKLAHWVDSLTAGEAGVPTAVLLVGGPGNGKTDAVEGTISRFDDAINAGGKLLQNFADQYKREVAARPPRMTEVKFEGLNKNVVSIEPTIRLVQDATENDPSLPGETAESLLLRELRQIHRGEYKGIYIGCVNRGILANTSSLATRNGDDEMASFLAKIISAASGGVEAPDCWPLEGSKLALWPMDVESLVAPSHEEEPYTSVAHRVLDKALAKESWTLPCENKADCPFCQNRALLENKKARDNLVRFLFHYELASGKRWTFRDLYSLVSYLFIGDPGSLVINGKYYRPCDWTAKMLQLEAKGLGSLESARARYLLTSRLYHHRLFPNWPRLATGQHHKAYTSVLAGKKIPEQLSERALNLAKFHFSTLKTLAENEQNSISELLSGDFSTSLDPALIHGERVLYTESRKGQPVTVNWIEEHFSLSVKDGLEAVSERLAPSERKLLAQLAEADETLQDHYHPARFSKQARLLQSSLRQFAARLVKRSLGLRFGVSKDGELLKKYALLYQSDAQYEEVEDLVEKLVNEDRRSFKIPLSTTFGQPVAHRDRDVSLRVRNVSTSMHMDSGNSSKPAARSPFIRVHNRYVPVTFALYKALKEIEEGLNPASLPQEVFALIDEVKSVTAGQVARDKDFVRDNVDLTIGRESYMLKVGKTVRFRK